jgi:hypothetical protein
VRTSWAKTASAAYTTPVLAACLRAFAVPARNFRAFAGRFFGARLVRW